MSNEARIQKTLEKVLAGQASEEELRRLVEALQQDEQFEMTEELTTILAAYPTSIPIPGAEKANSMVDAILQTDKLSPEQPILTRTPVVAFWKKIAVAAVILAVAVTTYFLWPSGKVHQTAGPDGLAGTTEDVNPGNNRARLILADGTQLPLDSLANGTVKMQGATRIAKQGDGQLTYENDHGAAGETILYNTIVVPRGGQYQLVLADGTRVWLNAASQLRYPVAFTGNDRSVELEGEGFFDVAQDAAKPFFVRTGTADVRVLGTRFNVSAYAAEDWKTTLLEGKVSVTPPNKTAAPNTQSGPSRPAVILQPGQQAIIADQLSNASAQSSKTTVRTADIDETIAWKEGYFHFTDASVKSIMAQVSRWYDVDIVYKDTAAGNALFNGRINRSIRLSGIVNALKQGGINCSIQQKRLLVYP